MDRRSFLVGTGALVAAGPTFAQEAFPSHAITIINAFPPGGINDIVTRPLAAMMEPILKRQWSSRPRPALCGSGAQVVASAKRRIRVAFANTISGYAGVDALFDRSVKASLRFYTAGADRRRPGSLVNDQPYKPRKNLLTTLKSVLTLVFSSGGLYGATHLPLALLDKATGGVKLRHLPTNGGGPAITAILGNNAQCTTQSVSATLPHIKAGKLRPLAVFSATRSKELPDVPTLKELGYDTEYYLWVGIFAPKATPAPIVLTLRDAIKKASHSDQFKTSLANAGQELAYLDGPDFQKFWDIDGARTDEAVKSIGRVQG